MRKDDMKPVSKSSGRSRGLRNKPMNGGGGGMRRGGGGSHNNNNNYFDSNGPGSIRVRGSASHLYDRYMMLARENSQGGDRTYSEGLYQHAEHYLRVQGSRGGGSGRGSSSVESSARESSARESSARGSSSVESSGGGRPRRDNSVQSRGGNRGRPLGKARFEQESYGGREGSEEEVRMKEVETYVSEDSDEDEDKQGLLDFLGGFDSK